MSLRARLLTLVAVFAAILAGTTLVVLSTLREAESAPAPEVAAADTMPQGPRIVFRSTTLDDDNGKVMAVPRENPGGPRAVVGPVCDRVDANDEQLVCSHTNRGVTTTFDQRLYVDGEVVRSWALPGIPSRTRLSPSGELVADTVFVSGHSYLQTGFSTATVIRETGTGRSLGNLEDWTLTVDGRTFDRTSRNFWGVTFVDDRTFYATAADGERTWLVEGDIESRTMSALRTNAECPSVSPDHRRVAYKKLTDERHWSVAVLDLATGEETVLGETRNVDDQVAWADDSALLYGLPREDTPGVTDVWTIGLDDGASPQLLIENAWSPAVVT